MKTAAWYSYQAAFFYTRPISLFSPPTPKPLIIIYRRSIFILSQPALDMLREIVCRSAEYFRYYHSLGDRSKYLTHNTSLMARNFYMGVDSYEKIAGDVEVLKAMPELRGIDLTAAKCNWTRYYLRQTLLSDARPLSRYHSLTETQQLSQPYSLRISDSTAETRLKQYLENGGAIEDLLDYAEFSEFPFTKYLEQ